jgi:glycosyltransferase involved in cell wall biosynthesis
MIDVSVVIPARNEHPQATFTLQAIWDQLEDAPFTWETILVDNLSDDKTGTFAEKRYWGQRGKHKVIRYDKEGSCWQARNAGISVAEGRLIFLFDAHVIVSPTLFVDQIEFFRAHPSAAICYTPVVWMGDSKHHRAYGYSLGPPDEPARHMHTKFWGSWTKHRVSEEPYRIPMSGTAGIALRREFLDDIGNWPAELSVYGGGEQWISLGCWMLGYEAWVHPGTYVYHFADYRKYKDNGGDKSTNDAHFFNVCLVAYALGGEKWWRARVDHMLKVWGKQYHDRGMALALEGKHAGEKYVRDWKYSLDEVLELRPWEAVCV